jgi:hypothetical protein
MLNSKFKIQNLVLTFCILHFAFCVSCSVPTLEAVECTEARTAVREFYSHHFAGEMQFTPANLKAKERFLSEEFLKSLPLESASRDPFTLTDDVPRAFRVGGCEVAESGKRVTFGVLLFWKSEIRTEQREIRVEAVKESDRWLINKISN